MRTIITALLSAMVMLTVGCQRIAQTDYAAGVDGNWFGNENGSFYHGLGSWIVDPLAVDSIVESFLDEDSALRLELNYEADYVADITPYRGMNYLSFWVNHATGIYTMWCEDAEGRCVPGGSYSKSGIDNIIDTVFIPDAAVTGYFRLEPLGIEYSDFDQCVLWSPTQRPPPGELLPVIPHLPPPEGAHEASVPNWFSSIKTTNATFENGGGDWTGPYYIIASYLGDDSAMQLRDPDHGSGAWLTQPIAAFAGQNVSLTYFCDGLSIYTLNVKDADGNVLQSFSQYHWHLFSDTLAIPAGAVTGEFNVVPHANSYYSTFDWFEMLPVGAPPPPPPPEPPPPEPPRPPKPKHHGKPTR